MLPEIFVKVGNKYLESKVWYEFSLIVVFSHYSFFVFTKSRNIHVIDEKPAI